MAKQPNTEVNTILWHSRSRTLLVAKKCHKQWPGCSPLPRHLRRQKSESKGCDGIWRARHQKSCVIFRGSLTEGALENYRVNILIFCIFSSSLSNFFENPRNSLFGIFSYLLGMLWKCIHLVIIAFAKFSFYWLCTYVSCWILSVYCLFLLICNVISTSAICSRTMWEGVERLMWISSELCHFRTLSQHISCLSLENISVHLPGIPSTSLLTHCGVSRLLSWRPKWGCLLSNT